MHARRAGATGGESSSRAAQPAREESLRYDARRRVRDGSPGGPGHLGSQCVQTATRIALISRVCSRTVISTRSSRPSDAIEPGPDATEPGLDAIETAIDLLEACAHLLPQPVHLVPEAVRVLFTPSSGSP
jgi:hypothetical protein